MLAICQYGPVMFNESQRAQIRRGYRTLRVAVEKTQLQVEALARIDTGKYWKIENGIVAPTPKEAIALARVLRCAVADLPIPSEEREAKAS